MNRKFVLVATLILALAVDATAAELRWKDAKTQTHFLYLPVEVDWYSASRKCSERGWDLFNIDYLDPEERQRWLESPELPSLSWVNRFRGEPGEFDETTVWMSSQSMAITWNQAGGASSYLHLKKFRGENNVRSRTSSIGKESRAHHTLCMYQSNTWEGCSQHLHCTYERRDGGTSVHRWALYEYGPHRSIALQRLRERAKNWPTGIGAKCEIPPSDPICLVYR